MPQSSKEGALALGATRWEMVRGVIFPSTRAGIAAAIILGLGRALGEAIAVTQVIGGGTNISANLFGPGDTLASRIAAQYQGAASALQISSLFYLGCDPARDRPRSRTCRAGDRAPVRPAAGGALMAAVSPNVSLRAERTPAAPPAVVNRLMESVGTLAALLAVGVLVPRRRRPSPSAAWPAFSWDFFTEPPNLFGGPGGGISSAIVGSAIIVGLATRHGACRSVC